jgi:predicted cupin superfamily sugar epimerase
MNKAEYWIEKFVLKKHPEGGYYREVYRSAESIAAGHLPERYSGGGRNHATSIYFLITGKEFSAFHRIKSDELFHFYAGSPLKLHMISEAGKYSLVSLGPGADNNEVFQYAIPHGVWFSAEVSGDAADSFSLVGCTVAPGFDFDDFELGKRIELLKRYPAHAEVIKRLTRE